MGTKERRQREVAQRREAILTAAKDLFRRHGYAGTTMPQIAEACEVAPGTLYLYFPSKEALYVELVFEGYTQLEAKLRVAVGVHEAPAAQAAAVIDTFFQFAQDKPEYFDIIFFITRREGAGGWKDSFPEGLVKRLYEREAACKGIAAEVLDRVWTDRSSRDKELALEAVWSMLSGVIFCFRGQELLAAVAQEAKQLILTNVTNQGA